MRPLLYEDNRATGARLAVGDRDDGCGLGQRRVLGAVLEAGEVAVVAR